MIKEVAMIEKGPLARPKGWLAGFFCWRWLEEEGEREGGGRKLKLSIHVCLIGDFVAYLFFSKCKLRLCSVSYMLMLCKCNLRYAL